MKTIKRTLSMLLVLLLCVASAGAEELYWNSSMRDTDLYTESVVTFNNYFTLTVPEDWQFDELSDNDKANGIIALFADDLSNPALQMTVSIFTPDECTDIFGGTGYDAIFESLSSEHDNVSSVQINNTWTIIYELVRDGHATVVVDFTTADGYMFQIKFEVYDTTYANYLNNIVWSLESVN